MNSFFALLFRQKYIVRWGLMRNTVPETLSEHTAETAVIAHALAVIGNTVFGKSYNCDRAASLALFHDAPEVYTSDLPTPIKYFSPEMKRGYDVIEEQAIGKLLSKLPEELKPAYSSLFSASETADPEMRLVKIADKLCAYIKCLSETSGGNREFVSAGKATKEKLDAIDSEELKYFMDNFLEPFTLTVDEL